MSAPFLRRTVATAVAIGVALTAVAVLPVATAQEVPPLPEEGAPIYAIVSAVANPACEASGTATLLVPIVGGLVTQNLGTGDSVPVGDLILDSLGPVFVVCGTLPPAPGSRCLLDDQIAGLLPDDVTSVARPPALLGTAVDALGAILSTLGIEGSDASVTMALECNVAGPAGAAVAPPAPPAAPPAPSLPTRAPAAEPSGAASFPALNSPAPAPVITAQPSATPPARIQTVLDLVNQVIPEWLQVVQLLLGSFLLLFLTMSWMAALRMRRGA